MNVFLRRTVFRKVLMAFYFPPTSVKYIQYKMSVYKHGAMYSSGNAILLLLFYKCHLLSEREFVFSSESERALLPRVFTHTRNLSWCQELQYRKYRHSADIHIIKVIKH